MLLGVCAVGVAYPIWWLQRSHSGGQALLVKARGREGLSGKTGQARLVGSCTISLTSSGAPVLQLPAIIDLPAIGLQAPVEDGVSDSVLNVAVGHEPGTPWPGQPGVSELLAHDVSWFSHLGAVKKGDTISWVDDCQQYQFQVVSTETTTPGSRLPNPPGGAEIALITCSPPDALFWTPDRFVVLARLIAEHAAPRSNAPSASPLGFKIAVPPALAADGLDLAHGGILVGHLKLTGSPATSWAEGPDPLAAAAQAFELDAAAARATNWADSKDWAAIALPHVPIPSPWSDAYDVDISIDVRGTTVESMTLTSPAAVLTLVPKKGILYVASVKEPTAA